MNVNMLLSKSGDVNTYLLDIYTASESATSLRKLKTGAVNCCEIRRSSDDATTIIYLEDEGQISLSSTVSAGGTLASWIGSDDGFLRTWYDQSGNGNDFQQTDTSLQWQLISAGSFILDSNGNIAFLNDTGSKDLPTNTDLSSGGSATIFGVFEIPSTETIGLLYSQISTATIYAATWNDGSSSTPDQNSGTCNYYTNGVLLNPKTRSNLYSSISIDEPVIFTTYIGDSTGYTNLEITGYDSSIGDTILKSNEYIIFNSDQSTNQSGIESNINDFYFP
tara:strand:+ start:120 stop:953 length:834 start_codon:yes stop_codon:yes gene_type:complete